MDDFTSDTFKLEKSTAMRRFRRLRSLTRLLRFVELFAAIAFLTWLSSRAPIAVNYLRRLSAAVASPLFVFFLGNAIVVALLAKSGRLTAVGNSESQIYDELSSGVVSELQTVPEKEIVFQDKEIICEEVAEIRNPRVSDSVSDSDSPSEKIESANCEEVAKIDPPEIRNPSVSDSVSGSDFLRLYRRSESEKIESANCEENRILRRSATDLSGKSEESEDGMSNEEFRRTIEEFIAKQSKFIREESSHSVPVSVEKDKIRIFP